MLRTVALVALISLCGCAPLRMQAPTGLGPAIEAGRQKRQFIACNCGETARLLLELPKDRKERGSSMWASRR